MLAPLPLAHLLTVLRRNGAAASSSVAHLFPTKQRYLPCLKRVEVAQTLSTTPSTSEPSKLPTGPEHPRSQLVLQTRGRLPRSATSRLRKPRHLSDLFRYLLLPRIMFPIAKRDPENTSARDHCQARGIHYSSNMLLRPYRYPALSFASSSPRRAFWYRWFGMMA